MNYQKLFDHMSKEHGVTLLEQEMQEIISIVNEMQADADTDSISEKSKPHCWGKMNWILKYKDGEEPLTSICRCEHGSQKCKSLTRENHEQNQKI